MYGFQVVVSVLLPIVLALACIVTFAAGEYRLAAWQFVAFAFAAAWARLNIARALDDLVDGAPDARGPQ